MSMGIADGKVAIVNAYLFSASDMADYISGAVLPVDALRFP